MRVGDSWASLDRWKQFMEYGDRKQIGIRQVTDSSQFFGHGAWQCNNDINPREEEIPAEGQSWEWRLGRRASIQECFRGTE